MSRIMPHPTQEAISQQQEWLRVLITYGYDPTNSTMSISEAIDNLYNAMRDTVYDIERGL